MKTLAKLERKLWEQWPIDLESAVGKIGTAIRISGFTIEDDEKFWTTNSKYLHEQSEQFIEYFYRKYEAKHAKTDTTAE